MTPAAPFDPDREVVDYQLTETVFENDADPTQLREFLRKCGTTGQLTLHLNQGGTTRITLIEKSKRAGLMPGPRSSDAISKIK
jgi:hypothetical protein